MHIRFTGNSNLGIPVGVTGSLKVTCPGSTLLHVPGAAGIGSCLLAALDWIRELKVDGYNSLSLNCAIV